MVRLMDQEIRYMGGPVKWEGCASGIFWIMTVILMETAAVLVLILMNLEKSDLFKMLGMSESCSG